MASIESKLNFTCNQAIADSASSKVVTLKADQPEAYYQRELNKYSDENNVDISDDNCSAMIMADFGAEDDTFFFWIEE